MLENCVWPKRLAYVGHMGFEHIQKSEAFARCLIIFRQQRSDQGVVL